MEARQQQIAAGREPVGRRGNNNPIRWLLRGCKYPGGSQQSTAPAVCRASLLQTDVSNTFQLHQQELDCVVCPVRFPGELLLDPSVNPRRGKKSIFFPQRLMDLTHSVTVKLCGGL